MLTYIILSIVQDAVKPLTCHTPASSGGQSRGAARAGAGISAERKKKEQEAASLEQRSGSCPEDTHFL